jgi:hypothetical protein
VPGSGRKPGTLLPRFTNGLVSFHEAACFAPRTDLPHSTNRLASFHEPSGVPAGKRERAKVTRRREIRRSSRELRKRERAKARESAKSERDEGRRSARIASPAVPFRAFACFRPFALPYRSGRSLARPVGLPHFTNVLVSFHEWRGHASRTDGPRGTCLISRMDGRETARQMRGWPAGIGACLIARTDGCQSSGAAVASPHELTGVVVGDAAGAWLASFLESRQAAPEAAACLIPRIAPGR